MPFIEEFVFLRPWWLLGAPLGIFLVMFVQSRNTGNWRKVCDRELLPHLLVGEEKVASRISRLLIALGWILATIALAGPAWDKEEAPIYGKTQALVIVFDLSQTMNSPDIEPSRLERARYAAIDLIERNPDQATGLVVFAGGAYVVAPVSEDGGTIVHLLQSLDTTIMPHQGESASAGLSLARNLLLSSGYQSGQVVLVADSINDEAFNQTSLLRQDGFDLSVVAVGTHSGAPIPTEFGGFLTDGSGNVLLAPVDRQQLQELAALGGGDFSAIDGVGGQVQFSTLAASLTDAPQADAERFTTAQWKDRGALLLILLVPLVALMFRREWIFAIAAVGLFHTDSSFAFEWDSLWQRADQRTAQAIARGDLDEAIKIAPDGQWLGAVLYRKANYQDSAIEYGRNSHPIDHYNHGNALAKGGDLLGALKQYDFALEIQPEFDDATFNRNLVLKALQSEMGGQNDNQFNRGGEDGEGGRGQQFEDPTDLRGQGEQVQGRDFDDLGDRSAETRSLGETGELPEDENSTQGSQSTMPGGDAAASEELDQLMEQWLRQVHDDPSGLLRRKFLHQSRSRNL